MNQINTNQNTESQIIYEISNQFALITEKTLNGMLKLNAKIDNQIIEQSQLKTDKSVFISTFFTGIVYGEFILAMSEQTARKISQIAEGNSPSSQEEKIQVESLTSLSEILNIISGQAITNLGKYYDKLTLTSPRIYSGNILYPNYPTGKKIINSSIGEIECHFYLDRMQLDLAVSYQEALQLAPLICSFLSYSQLTTIHVQKFCGAREDLVP
jgi:CheY-specific phosphatase CheX